MDGEIEVMKSQLADKFTFILTGQLDISKTYNWDEFLEFAGYFGSLPKGDVGVEYKGMIVEGVICILKALTKINLNEIKIYFPHN